MSRLGSPWFLIITLALGLTGAAPAWAAEDPAATVLYAFGSVSALDRAGRERALARGAPVYSGETVQTLAGRTHLRLTDGGFAALQPNTSYKFEDYSWSGSADGSEKGVFSLLRGALRVVTGAIGKANRSSFRLTTPTATIGIRGTSGLIQTCQGDCGEKPDGTYLTGYGGIWDLTSGGFNGPVTPGETYFCDGKDCRRIELPPASRTEVDNTLMAEQRREDEIAPPQDKADGIRADQVDPAGRPMILSDLPLGGAQPQNPPQNQFLSGFSAASAVGTGLNTQARTGLFSNVNVVVNGAGNIVGFSTGPGSDGLGNQQFGLLTQNLQAYRAAALAAGRTDILALLDQGLDPAVAAALAQNPASIVEYASAANQTITYGRFAGGNLLEFNAFSSGGVSPFSYVNRLEALTGQESRHFILGTAVVGTPSNVIGTYSFSGGSASTSASGATIGQGVISGSLQWDFMLSEGVLNMLVRHGTTDYTVSGGVGPGEGPNLFSDIAGESVSAFDGVSNYLTSIRGFFAGAVSSSAGTSGAPLGAGLQYTINTPDPILGTAAFGLSGTSPSVPAINAVSVEGHTATSAPFGTGNGPGITPDFLIFVDDLFAGVGGEDSFLDQTQTVVFQTGIATTSVAGLREIARQSGGQSAQRLAILAGIDPSLELALAEDPAEWTEDGIARIGGPDSLSSAAFGRFMTGSILSYKHSRDTNDATLNSFTSLETLRGTQARHVVYGETYLNDALPALVGSFDFVGGTPSTTEAGGTVGLGITQGRITFDFNALSGSLDMTVNHDALDWTVGGSFTGNYNGLSLDFDQGGLLATATGQPSTTAQVSGVFLGAPDLGGLPPGLGLAYQIFTLDPIVGAGVFSLGNVAPSTALSELNEGAMVSWAAPLLSPVISLGFTLGSKQDYLRVGAQSPPGSPGNQFPTALVDGARNVRAFAGDGNSVLSGTGTMSFAMVNSDGPLSAGEHLPTASRWARFGFGQVGTTPVDGDYDLTVSGQAIDRTSNCGGTNTCGAGDFYVAYTSLPTPANAQVSGSSSYVLTNGATTLTLRDTVNALSNTPGTIDSVDFQLDFTNGLVSVADIRMSYADLQASATLRNAEGTSKFALGAPIVVNVISGTNSLASLVTTNSTGPLASCIGGCGLSGQMVIIPAGAVAENLVGTFRADVLAGPDASVTGGFVAGPGQIVVGGTPIPGGL